MLLPDGFSIAELTAAINGQPRKPGLVGRLGLFHSKGVRTRTVVIQDRDGVISLVQSTLPGAPGVNFTPSKAKTRALTSARIHLQDAISASELQGAVQFGTEELLKTLEGEVADRQAQMLGSVELTLEHHLLGALRGQVLDADGSELYSLYEFLGVTARTAIDLDLDNADVDLEAKFDEVKYDAIDDGRGMVDTGSEFLAIYGRTAWKKFKGHAKVAKSYDRYQDGAWLRQGKGATEVAFDLFGFRHIEYVGGLGVGLGANEVRFLPISSGANGLYQVRYTPADSFEAVNSEGLPLYSWTEQPSKSRLEVHLETNPVAFCLAPRVLRAGTA